MGCFLCVVKRTIRQSKIWLMTGIIVFVASSGWGLLTESVASELDISSNTREAIRFSVADLTATWELKSLREGTLNLYEASLSGFLTSGPVGSPRVPVRGGWLIVPPGTRPEARVISEQWVDAGKRPLTVEMTPTVWRGVENYDSGVSEILVMPGETVPEGYSIPAGALADLARRSAM